MLTISVVGKVEIRPNASGPLTRGGREALAYLVLNGASPRSRVAAALWPDSDEPQALYNLRRALMELRRNLGPEAPRLKAAGRGDVELDLTGVEVDLHRIRTALAEGAYDVLAELCGDAPLDGVAGAWAAPARQALRAELTQGLVLAARHAAGVRGVAEAEAFLRAALPHSRRPRSVWQALVRLHSEAGDYKAARRILAECEASSLGADAASLTPAETPNPVLPESLGDLVGRQDVLARLATDLGEFRLVTLCGTGGMGKTRTALALARRMEAAFPGGVAFVELVGASNGEASVREAVARALGLRVEQGAAWNRVIDWLSNRRALLVLDNAEHVVGPTAAVVSDLLARTSNLRLLVTSRVPLGLPIERRRKLSPLRPSEAHAMFAARAAAADPDYRPTEESERLCAQLDGIPLAIELAAAQVGSVPLAHLSARLAASLTLDSVSDGHPERHRTMRAALQVSFEALAPERRRAFVALGVFAEGFTPEAALAVAGIGPAELGRLATVSLVEFDGERYRMLEPVRQLAVEELGSAGEEATVRTRHARWFAQEARETYDGPFPYDRDPRKYRVDRRRWLLDHANVRAAIAHLEARDEGLSDDALALWLVQSWYRLIEQSAPDAQAWLARLEAAPTASIGSRIAAHWWLTVGMHALWNDQDPRSKALFARLAQTAVDREYLDVYAYIGQLDGPGALRDPFDGEIRTGGEVAIRIFERLGMDEPMRHAKILRVVDESVHAPWTEKLSREVEEIATESLERGEIRTHVLALRLLAKRQGRWEERQAILRRALRLQRSVGHWAEVHTLRTLGYGARELGAAQDEIEVWEELIRRGEAIGYVGNMAEAHLELARAFLRSGQESRMWASMARSLSLIRAQERPGFLHLAIAHLADMVRLTGDARSCDELVAYLQRAATRGLVLLEGKLEELHPGISSGGPARGSAVFASADDVVGWVEIRAALRTDEAETSGAKVL